MNRNRELTKRLLAAATGWREAARILQSKTAEGVFLWPPFYTMLFYAIEQSLKAFLASRGATRTDLKNIQHNLNELVERTEDQGFKIEDRRLAEFIKQLEGKLLELRYLEGDGINLAEPEEAIKLLDAHFLALTRYIDVDGLIDPGRSR